MNLKLNPIPSDFIEQEKAVSLILNYISDLKLNKVPAYPLPLKGTEHEYIIKELNSLVQKNEQQNQQKKEEINDLISLKEEAQNESKEHVQFMLSVVQNILNPLNGVLGFIDIIVSGGDKISQTDKEKYVQFIRQGEFTLLQNVDYISAYANILNSYQPGSGYCRSKHLLQEVEKDVKSVILPKMKASDVSVVFDYQMADLFLHVSENALKLIWSVLIEFVLGLFQHLSLDLRIFKEEENLVLKSVVKTSEHIHREQISGIEQFIQNSMDKNLLKPQIGIPLFIAQKQISLLNGNLQYELISTNELSVSIIIPNAFYMETE
jgi:K+-sensing histidine kinase KdpD